MSTGRGVGRASASTVVVGAAVVVGVVIAPVGVGVCCPDGVECEWVVQ